MNTTRAAATSSGLEGISVADTRLSLVDGEHGRLVVAGFEIEELARRSSFEATAELLWTGALPDQGHEADLRAKLGAARVDAFAKLARLGDALEHTDGMDALRAAVAQLAGEPTKDHGPHSTRQVAIAVTGALPVFAAAWARKRRRLSPLPPDPTRGQSADYLWMIRGEQPAGEESLALDRYLVTVADHGMNASTFAARVVASTGSDLVSAISAAIGALKGPLHGGAPGPVLDMLDAIGTAERARAWLLAELEAGRRIMGMGHRIYRVRDPRVAVLEEAARMLSGRRLTLAHEVERIAEGLLAERHPGRPLKANVEFATAVLLEAVGLPRESFSPTFAVGRVAGWIAHVMEQREGGRLIRPSSRYIGPPA